MLYLDNAATTPLLPEVREVMMNYMVDNFGNPSSIYKIGRMNRIAVEEARKTIADTIGACPDDIFFTSGGTESDNWVLESTAIWDTVEKNMENEIKQENNAGRSHIIVSSIEHPAVINKCMQLKKRGCDVDYIKVNKAGIINTDDLISKIRDNTKLISVMLVNNEIGTIQPIRKVCSIAAEYGIPVHTDAVAAYGHIPVNVNELGVDYLSVSAHKIGGAKGVGFLYAKDAKINPYICGGGQERGKRSGTENVAGIMGLAKAAEMAQKNLGRRMHEENVTKSYIMGRILREIKNSSLNGDYKNRISGNMNFGFKGVNGGELVIMLDKNGICVSAGSACHGNSGGPSHVLKAIGLDDESAQSSIRLTLGRGLTRKECDYCVECIKRAVWELRSNAV